MSSHTKTDPKTLCAKIKEIYPDIGACGIDVTAQYDERAKAWAVTLNKQGHSLKTFLDDHDIHACEMGKECVHLGAQIGQLKKNIGLA
jgi:hypothetical protein